MENTKRFTIIKWSASILGFVGAALIAINIDISKYAFFIFLVSSIAWVYAGYVMKEYSIVFLNIGFTAINLLGVYRWVF